jgi:hypothetical protein
MQKVNVVSERRACQDAGVSRSTQHYKPKCSEEEQQLSRKTVELAEERRAQIISLDRQGHYGYSPNTCCLFQFTLLEFGPPTV